MTKKDCEICLYKVGCFIEPKYCNDFINKDEYIKTHCLAQIFNRCDEFEDLDEDKFIYKFTVEEQSLGRKTYYRYYIDNSTYESSYFHGDNCDDWYYEDKVRSKCDNCEKKLSCSYAFQDIAENLKN